MAEDLYGRGLAFPLRTGALGLAQSTGVAKVEESVRIILGTGHGERVMRPTFGCHLASLTFAPNTATTANLARYYVTDALTRWEPRIDVLDVVVENDNRGGRLLIVITYRLRSTRDVHHLTYQFTMEGTP